MGWHSPSHFKSSPKSVQLSFGTHVPMPVGVWVVSQQISFSSSHSQSALSGVQLSFGTHVPNPGNTCVSQQISFSSAHSHSALSGVQLSSGTHLPCVASPGAQHTNPSQSSVPGIQNSSTHIPNSGGIPVMGLQTSSMSMHGQLSSFSVQLLLGTQLPCPSGVFIVSQHSSPHSHCTSPFKAHLSLGRHLPFPSSVGQQVCPEGQAPCTPGVQTTEGPPSATHVPNPGGICAVSWHTHPEGHSQTLLSGVQLLSGTHSARPSFVNQQVCPEEHFFSSSGVQNAAEMFSSGTQTPCPAGVVVVAWQTFPCGHAASSSSTQLSNWTPPALQARKPAASRVSHTVKGGGEMSSFDAIASFS